jgi:hypothetical protein
VSSVEERLRRLEKEVARLRRLVEGGGGGGGRVVAEEEGVALMEGGDLFGSYVVVDRDGTQHAYGDRRAAERTFRLLVERARRGGAGPG